MKVKELEKQIKEMVDNFQHNHFKEQAYKELAKVDLCKKWATRHIIEEYPDFDGIVFKITSPDKYVVKFHVNPDLLKDNPKAIRKVAKLFASWAKWGEIK